MKKYIYCVIIIFGFLTCNQEQNAVLPISFLFEDFQERKKRPRFKNAKLLFGDTLNKYKLRSLGMGKDLLDSKIYSSFSIKRGDYFYFLYGVSSVDSLVSTMRLVAFHKETFIMDTLLIDFEKFDNTTFDYWIDKDKISVQSTKLDGSSHYSTYEMSQGYLKNRTIIPDSIFIIDPLSLDGVGRKVIIYNDYETKELILPTKKHYKIEGRLHKLYGFPYCWVIQLDDNELIKTEFVSVRAIRNSVTPLYLLSSDSMIMEEDIKYGEVPYPIEDPVLFLDRIYVDYKD